MKKLFAYLLVAAMTLSFVACGAPASSVAPAAPSKAASAAPETKIEPANLTYWYWADNTEQSDLMQSIVAKFNETNQNGIKITAEEYPWDSGGFTNTIFTAIMGGGGPDLSTFKLAGSKMFTANKLLGDMSTYVDAWADAGQISDSAWTIMKNATDNGTVSVLPFTMEGLYVYYRPSYFKKAGVEVPKTWDEFMTAIEKCTMDTNGDGKTDVYGFGMRGAGGGQEHLGNFLYANGASWDDLTTDAAVAAYEQYLNIYQKGYAPESASSAAYAEVVDGFKTGLTAMFIHHIGSSTTWLETFGEDVDAFAMPTSDKGRWTCAGDTEIVVYEKCENKAAAFEFYKYMTTGEGGTAWFKGTGKGLGTENVKATEEFAKNRFQAIAAESLQFAGVLPATDTLTEFTNTVWASANQQALLGKISAKEALTQMQKALHG